MGDFRITAICSRDPARARLLAAAEAGERAAPDSWRYGDALDEYFSRHGSADAASLFPRGVSDPFGLLIGDWLAAIREGRPAETSGEEGLRDLAASFAIVESSLAGQAVTLTEVLSSTVDAYQRDLDQFYGLRDS